MNILTVIAPMAPADPAVINESGLWGLVGVAVTVLMVIIGLTFLAKSKNTTLSQAGERSAVGGIGLFWIGAAAASGVATVGLFSGIFDKVIS